MDKRERHRIKRAHLRQARARGLVRAEQSLSRLLRVDELIAVAEEQMAARDFAGAVRTAARAVALAPHDRLVAVLYAGAAESSGEVRHGIRSLEHLGEVAGPTPGLLTLLAELYCQTGDFQRAREVVAEAREHLLRGGRRRLPEALARLERALGVAEAGPVPRDRRGLPARTAATPLRPERGGQTSLLFTSRGALPADEVASSPMSWLRPAPRPRAGTAGVPAESSGSAAGAGAAVALAPARRAVAARATTGAAAAPAVAATPRAQVPRTTEVPPAAPAPTAPLPPAGRPAPATPRAPGVLDIFDIPITLSGEIAGLGALEGLPASGLEEATLAQLAAELADADSFDRLLGLERAQGLLRLSHQEETVRKVLSVFLGRALLADEVGLGKTIEAGLVLSELWLRGRVQRALVLVPPTLVGQWREELQSKFSIDVRTTEDGLTRGDEQRLWHEPGVLVASLATARSARNRDAVAAEAWDLVIVDEAHTLKNHRTESYALVERLRTRFFLLLTATPVENRVEEIYNLVSLLRPGHLGGRAAFVRRFGGTGPRTGVATGATAGAATSARTGAAEASGTGMPRSLPEAARAELRALLGEVMVRNTRALSGVHLPPRFARTLLVAPGPEEEALYEALVGALRSLGAVGRARPLLSLLLQEAGSSPIAVRDTLTKLASDREVPAAIAAGLEPAIELASKATSSEKGRALAEALLAAPEPTIVFTRFRGTLGFLATALERAGIRHERLDGAMAPPARAAAVERCRASGAVLVSTDVGSEGLNLQLFRRIVNFDLPWNPMRIEQRIGRLHRIGQDHPVEVLNFCLAGSIEERILRILDERINLFELVVGEIETILGYLETGHEFPELVLNAFAHGDAGDRERAFTRLGDALAQARQRYRAVKSFDEALFRSELGV